MRLITTFIFSLFSISFFFGQMTPEKWKEDINFLRENLSKKHYNLFFKRDKMQFDKDLDKIISQSNKHSDLEIILKLQQIIAKQGDTHTFINWSRIDNYDEKYVPLNYYSFKDGVYVTLTNSNHKNLIGKKVLSINGFDIKTIRDSISTLVVNENSQVHKRVLGSLSSIGIMKFFGFTKNDSLKFKLSSDNEVLEEVLTPEKTLKSEKITLQPPNTFRRENKKNLFAMKYYEKDQILYVIYNKCVSKEEPSFLKGKPEAEKLPSFLEFQNQILKTIASQKVEKLFFDMRFNSGGSSNQGTQLIKKLAEIPSINKKGKLFVGIGRETFSSAILNTVDFEENTKAIFVGEETEGKPNHYGEVKDFVLPNSNLKVQYSTNLFIRTKKKNVTTITPDYIIEETFEDYKNGIDPVFEFVKNYK